MKKGLATVYAVALSAILLSSCASTGSQSSFEPEAAVSPVLEVPTMEVSTVAESPLPPEQPKEGARFERLFFEIPRTFEYFEENTYQQLKESIEDSGMSLVFTYMDRVLGYADPYAAMDVITGTQLHVEEMQERDSEWWGPDGFREDIPPTYTDTIWNDMTLTYDIATNNNCDMTLSINLSVVTDKNGNPLHQYPIWPTIENASQLTNPRESFFNDPGFFYIGETAFGYVSSNNAFENRTYEFETDSWISEGELFAAEFSQPIEQVESTGASNDNGWPAEANDSWTVLEALGADISGTGYIWTARIGQTKVQFCLLHYDWVYRCKINNSITIDLHSTDGIVYEVRSIGGYYNTYKDTVRIMTKTGIQ